MTAPNERPPKPVNPLWSRVRRRKIVEWAMAYVAGAWLVLEALDLLGDNLGWPPSVFRVALVLIFVGLLAALVLAWYHGEQGRQRVSGMEILMLAGILVIAGGVVALVGGEGDAAAGAAGVPVQSEVASSPGAADGAPSIAVLPPENLSPDPDNAFFAAGFHEEILTRLGKVEGLNVRGRRSVMRFRDREIDLREIGRQLGVRYLLDSSVRWEDDRVAISVQLIDAEEDDVVWGDAYQRDYAGIFEIQSDVAMRVVQEVRGVLTPEERARLADRPTDRTEAYDHYIRGHGHFQRSSLEVDARAAAEAYERAVDVDPNFAAAWARLVQTRVWLSWNHGDYGEWTRARSALDRLEAVAPESGDLHFARGIWRYYGELRFDEALSEFEALRELRPGDLDLVLLYEGALYRRLGQWASAVKAMEGALEYEPLAAEGAGTLARTYIVMRGFDQAERYARRAVSLDPAVPQNWWWLVYGRLSRGDTAAARSAVDSAGRQLGEPGVESMEAWALWHFYSRGAEEVLDWYGRRQSSVTSGIFDLGLAAASAAGRRDLLRSYTDTLRTAASRVLSSAPTGYLLQRSLALSQLALVEAYMGNQAEAVRLADEAVELYPVSRDALHGPRRVLWQAHVYTVVGRYAEAIDKLRYLRGIPADMVTVPLLRMDMRWDPLRDHQGFQALLEDDGSS